MSASSAPVTTRVGTVIASKRTEYRSASDRLSAASAVTVGARVIGELAEGLPGGVVDRRRVVGQERGRDRFGRAATASRWRDRRAHAAEHEGAGTRLIGHEAGCDHRAHRVADHVDLLDTELVENRLCVAHHGVAGVPVGIVRLVRPAVTPGVGRDDAPAHAH